jgi:hypothetical protein
LKGAKTNGFPAILPLYIKKEGKKVTACMPYYDRYKTILVRSFNPTVKRSTACLMRLPDTTAPVRTSLAY